MTSEVEFFFKMFDIVADGLPFDFKASETWVSSFLTPSAVLGRLSARFRRVEAVLILCFNS